MADRPGVSFDTPGMLAQLQQKICHLEELADTVRQDRPFRPARNFAVAGSEMSPSPRDRAEKESGGRGDDSMAQARQRQIEEMHVIVASKDSIIRDLEQTSRQLGCGQSNLIWCLSMRFRCRI